MELLLTNLSNPIFQRESLLIIGKLFTVFGVYKIMRHQYKLGFCLGIIPIMSCMLIVDMFLK